jgi:hypothetical protein
MCLVDTKEIERAVATEENLKVLVQWANVIFERLVDEGYTLEVEYNEPEDYPCLDASRKESL